MKFKRITGLVICAVLLVSVLAGCQQKAKSPFVSPNASPAANTAANPTAPAQTLNMAGAAKAYDPKTVMLTVNGKDITWDELFFYISYTIGQIQSDGAQITDWSAPYQDETSYRDYVLDNAVKALLQSSAIEYGADQQKISLTPKDQQAIQADWDTQVKSAGSEEAVLAQLQSQYSSKDLYNRLETVNYLAEDCFTAMYGDKGSKLSDQDVADYTSEDGYIMAKHILMLTSTTDENGNQTPMSDADKAKVKQKMEDILAQLKAYKGDDFGSYFDQLMKQYSQDPGVQQFPDGYLFQSGDMVSQFYDGAKALQVGSFTPELVQTDYGYHIIYRVPLNYDVTPMKYSNYGQYSLRFIAARQMFVSNIDTWENNLSVTYTDKYKALDFNKLFA